MAALFILLVDKFASALVKGNTYANMLCGGASWERIHNTYQVHTICCTSIAFHGPAETKLRRGLKWLLVEMLSMSQLTASYHQCFVQIPNR